MANTSQYSRPDSAQRARQDPDVRRTGLLNATVRVLAKFGAQGLSTRIVAEEAGVRQGLISYYFKSKDEMLVESYEHLSKGLSSATQENVDRAANDPRSRLYAYLSAGFQPEMIDSEVLRARVALWSIAATHPQLHAVHIRIYDEFRDGLGVLVAPLATNSTVDPNLVFAVSAMLDGLWLELAAGRTDYSIEDVLSRCMDMITGS